MQNMQYEKTSNKLDMLKQISNIKLSNCRSYHLFNDNPLYEKRFTNIEKFHHPGLAPVSDKTGSYHINLDGTPAYKKRYNKTFGFYCTRAAVIDNGEYYHINIKGDRVYKESYDWLGNYQENKCIARKEDKFFHIDLDGNEIYSEKYDYVGDFKDDIAVVYKQGKASHINCNGKLVHNKWYNKLGVYHKGFATAEEGNGWFHINILGVPIYESRYKMVEPFYNGLAKVESFSGILGQIDVKNNMVCMINRPKPFTLMNQISGELVGFWKTEVIYTAVDLGLIDSLPNSLEYIHRKLSLPFSHTKRLLRALWEIDIVGTDNNVWYLTDKGKMFFPSDVSFLASASRMWRKLNGSYWKQLPKLIKENYNRYHPSFKELSSQDEQKFYNHAIDGYNDLEAEDLKRMIPFWSDFNDIIFVGRSAKSLMCKVVKDNLNIKATLIGNTYELFDINIDVDILPRIQILTKELPYYQWKIKGDVIFFLRVLHSYPDEYVNCIINQALKSLNKGGKIIIAEMIAFESEPNGSLLDLNQFVETGGKIRTLKDWELIAKTNNCIINSVIDIDSSISVMEIVNES